MTTDDFADAVMGFASNIPDVKNSCKNEEGTKHSMILPLIQLLGYNVFDPKEVVPEVDCDIRGGGDKVDYVIQHNGEHLILMECKHWTKDLDYYVSQLQGYFVGSRAHFAVLTNGIEYRFYADLDNANLMDDKPFLVLDMERLTKRGLNGLKLFCKDNFSESILMEQANDMKLSALLREDVQQELSNPSFEMVTHFARRIYGKMPSRSVRERMQPMLADSLAEYRLSVRGVDMSEGLPSIHPVSDGEHGVLEAVQGILKDIVPSSRVQLFTGAGYSAVRLDGSQWWPIIKFKYTGYSKWVAVGKYCPQSRHFSCHSKDDRRQIESVADIDKFSKDIKDIVAVMLIGGVGQDEQRVAWVRENRPDWCA